MSGLMIASDSHVVEPTPEICDDARFELRLAHCIFLWWARVTFSGLVMAHVLGRGAAELAGIGPRVPLLPQERVVLFGYNVESGWIDTAELHALGQSAMLKYPRFFFVAILPPMALP
jgi:hypothetical protein